MSDCTVYIDESGDLGICRGTTWFILSAVIVDKNDEPAIRNTLAQIRSKLNIQEIHLRKINDYYKRAYIARELTRHPFTYMNVIVDTTKLSSEKNLAPLITYNYSCRLLLERASWLLRDTERTGDIVLSARGTARDNELIQYLYRLLNSPENELYASSFGKNTAKSSATWDLLQLADVCATSLFVTYELNRWGFRTPCLSKVLRSHLYQHNGSIDKYGLKYFDDAMRPDMRDLRQSWMCENIPD